MHIKDNCNLLNALHLTASTGLLIKHQTYSLAVKPGYDTGELEVLEISKMMLFAEIHQ